MCIQCLLKRNYVSCYLPITELGKLSDWSFNRSDCFSSCFCLLVGLAIFVDGVL